MAPYRNELEAAYARIADLSHTVERLERERVQREAARGAPARAFPTGWVALVTGALVVLTVLAGAMISPPARHAPPVAPPPVLDAPSSEPPAALAGLAGLAGPAPAPIAPSVEALPETVEPPAPAPAPVPNVRHRLIGITESGFRVDRGDSAPDPGMDHATGLVRSDPRRAGTTFFGQYWEARVVRSQRSELPVDTRCLVRMMPGAFHGSGAAVVQCGAFVLQSMGVSPPGAEASWCWFDGEDLFCAPPDTVADENCWLSTVTHHARCHGDIDLSINTVMRDPREDPVPRL